MGFFSSTQLSFPLSLFLSLPQNCARFPSLSSPFFPSFPYTWLYPNKSIKLHTLYLLLTALFLSFPLPTPCVLLWESQESVSYVFFFSTLPISYFTRTDFEFGTNYLSYISRIDRLDYFLVATIPWSKLEFSPTICISAIQKPQTSRIDHN